MRLAVVLAICALAACGRGAPDDSLLLLPSDFSEGMGIADLEARFGKDNVSRGEVPNAYGDPPRGAILFADDPTRRAYVAFHDEDALQGISSIEIRDPGSRWRGKHGVRIGSTFAELRKLNDHPFYFQGFDGQNRGWVRDSWSPALDDDGGKLGAFDVVEGDHLYFGVELGPRGQVPADARPNDEASAFSDDPKFPRLGELFEVKAFSAWSSLDDEWS